MKPREYVFDQGILVRLACEARTVAVKADLHATHTTS